MAYPFKRDKSPFWWVGWREASIRFRQSTGIHHNGSNRPPRGSTVWEVCRSIEDRLARQKFGLAAVIIERPIAEYFNEFMLSYTGHREKSIERYRAVAKAFSTWAKGQGLASVSSVHHATATQYVDSARTKKAAITIRAEVVWLAAAWKEAKRRGYTSFEENPWAIRLKVPKSTRTKFSDTEIQSILGAEMPGWLRTCIMIGLYTGARIDSIRPLQWEHVGLDFGVINFPKSKTNPYSVPLPDALVQYLRPLAQPSGPVLPLRVLGRADSYISQRFVVLTKKLGMVGATFHRFRHTWTSKLANAAVDKRISQSILNHASADVHDGYTHIEAASLRPHIATIRFQ